MSDTESANQIHSFSRAVQGGLWGMVLVFFALISVDLGQARLGFMFLPVAAIFFWPKTASHSWSLVGVFTLGLFYDVVSAGPLGLWALVLLIVFILMGGGAAAKIKFWPAVAGYSLGVAFVFVILLIFGKLTLTASPNAFSLGMNAAGSILIFPIIYWLRSLFVSGAKEKAAW